MQFASHSHFHDSPLELCPRLGEQRIGPPTGREMQAVRNPSLDLDARLDEQGSFQKWKNMNVSIFSLNFQWLI
jgi:hypothetical protein